MGSDVYKRQANQQVGYIHQDATFSNSKSFDLGNGVVGRYVKVQIEEKGTLSLAEVQVFGYIKDSELQSSTGNTRTIIEETVSVNKEDSVSLYPIPATTQLYVNDATGDTIKHITIFNMAGLQVNYLEADHIESINISNLPEGRYFMVIEKDAGISITKSFLKI